MSDRPCFLYVNNTKEINTIRKELILRASNKEKIFQYIYACNCAASLDIANNLALNVSPF